MALIANPQRGPGTKPYTQDDFMLGSRVVEAPDEPEFIDDPVAHSNLIRAAMFGIPPK